MSPHHETQEANAHHAIREDLIAQEGLSSGARQNVGDNAQARENRDVNLGMAKEPEQMLPQQRRSAGMRLHLIADNEAAGNKETGAADVVEDQENARREQNRERKKAQHRGNQPSPHSQRHAHQRHASSSKVERGGDKIQSPKKRPNAKGAD